MACQRADCFRMQEGTRGREGDCNQFVRNSLATYRLRKTGEGAPAAFGWKLTGAKALEGDRKGD